MSYTMKRIGSKSMFVFEDDQYIVMVSYRIPVAYMEKGKNTLYQTCVRWSNTTTRHMSKFRQLNNFPDIVTTEQSEVDEVLYSVAGFTNYADGLKHIR